jgi:4-hydroxybenzoate polyprenyltransferase
MSAVRRLLLQAEAAWWMTRIYLSNINIWPVFMGWAAAQAYGHRTGAGPLVLLALYVAFAGGALFIVNDILDADGDQVTAPYLPLPSGLLTMRQSWAWAGAYLAAGIAALYLAAGAPGRFALSLGITVAGVLAAMAYSKVKEDGFIASIIVTIPQTLPAVIAWLLAGSGPLWALGVVVAYCVLACISNNILAALRDVDLDGEVDNRTLPVRIGGAPAFRLAARIAFTALGPIAVLCVAAPHGWWAAPVGLVAAAILGGACRRTLTTFEETGRGRVQRMKDLKTFKLGEYVRHAAVVAAFDPTLALVAGVLMYASLYFGHRVYTRRLINGDIRRALAATRYAPADAGNH